VVVDAKFDEVKNFADGLAPVKQGRKWGFVDKNNRLIMNPQFEDANSFSDGVAAVKESGMWRFVDKKGAQTVGGLYEVIDNFTDSLAFVKTSAKKPSKKELVQIKQCEAMESGLFKDAQFSDLCQEMICVKSDIRELPRDLEKKYKVKAAPLILIYDCKGKKSYAINDPKTDLIKLLIDLREVITNSNEKRSDNQ
jgi:hypothetical protein